MACMLSHEWGWPRKRGDKDVQVCIQCGRERISAIQFEGPRYRKTQDGIPNFSRPAPNRGLRVMEAPAFSSVA